MTKERDKAIQTIKVLVSGLMVESDKPKTPDQELIEQTVKDLMPTTVEERIAKAAGDFIKQGLNRPSAIRMVFPIKEVKESDG